MAQFCILLYYVVLYSSLDGSICMNWYSSYFLLSITSSYSDSVVVGYKRLNLYSVLLGCMSINPTIIIVIVMTFTTHNSAIIILKQNLSANSFFILVFDSVSIL